MTKPSTQLASGSRTTSLRHIPHTSRTPGAHPPAHHAAAPHARAAAHHLPHTSHTPRAHLPHTSRTPAARLPHTSHTPAARLPHTSHTPAAQPENPKPRRIGATFRRGLRQGRAQAVQWHQNENTNWQLLIKFQHAKLAGEPNARAAKCNFPATLRD